jgi:hypothetical protein
MLLKCINEIMEHPSFVQCINVKTMRSSSIRYINRSYRSRYRTFSGADIQVTQATNLDGTATNEKQLYLLQLGYAFTKTYSLTFSVALNTDATVSSMNYTVNNSANTITDIPFGTTLEIFKLNIQAAETQHSRYTKLLVQLLQPIWQQVIK